MQAQAMIWHLRSLGSILPSSLLAYRPWRGIPTPRAVGLALRGQKLIWNSKTIKKGLGSLHPVLIPVHPPFDIRTPLLPPLQAVRPHIVSIQGSSRNCPNSGKKTPLNRSPSGLSNASYIHLNISSSYHSLPDHLATSAFCSSWKVKRRTPPLGLTLKHPLHQCQTPFLVHSRPQHPHLPLLPTMNRQKLLRHWR